MFEGKHKHFSPVDNKPLCSYSNKLCRQRRLIGYAFCIRHILEDKSAPFKQCEFITKNKYHKCLNAIPSNQERGYCHSHMQVAGMIPKPCRKSKIFCTIGSQSAKCVSSPVPSFDMSIQNELCVLPRTRTDKIEIQNKQTNYKVTEGGNITACSTSADHKKKIPLTKEDSTKSLCMKETSIQTKSVSNKSISQNQNKNGVGQNDLQSPWIAGKYLNLQDGRNISVTDQIRQQNKPEQRVIRSTTPSCKKKYPISGSLSADPDCCSHVYTLCIQDCWQKYFFNFRENNGDKFVAVKLKHVKLVRILQKMPLFREMPLQSSSSLTDIKRKSKNGQNKSMPLSNAHLIFFPPILSKRKTNFFKATEGQEDGSPKSIHSNTDANDHKICDKPCQLGDSKNVYSENFWEWETRRHFLVRVRQAFKQQYKTMMKVHQFTRRVERKDRAFRTALLSCAVDDTGLCAQILSTNNLKIRTTNSNSTIPLLYGKSCFRKRESTLDHKNRPANCKSRPLNPQLKNKKNCSNSSLIVLESENRSTPRKLKLLDGSTVHKLTTRSQRAHNAGNSLEGINNDREKVSHLLVNSRKAGYLFKSNSVRKSRLKLVPNNKSNPSNDGSIDNDFLINKKCVQENCKNQDSTLKAVYNCGVNHVPKANDPVLRRSPACQPRIVTPLNPSYSSKLEASSSPDNDLTDTSFDSPLNHSISSHPDCEFPDDDLDNGFQLQIDPDIAHQASRLFDDNGLTEDDFNELFPEARDSDHKFPSRTELSDLGIDFTSNFDAADIDNSLFANIFPNFKSHQLEAISVTQQF